MTRQLLRNVEVANRLSVTINWLYDNRAKLEADGFPKPVFGNRAAARWDSAAIDAWLNAKLPPPPAGTTMAIATKALDLVAAGVELDKRSDALAARVQHGRRA